MLILENDVNALTRPPATMRFRPVRPLFVIIGLMLWVVMSQNSCLAQPIERAVYVVNISGTVDPGMAAFMERVLDLSVDDPDALFVFEMDTFGGRVDSALQIVDTLLSVPQDRTIAFVKNKAISAGALIALACGRLAMRKNTTIGDCAPITYSKEGPKMLGEKFQSPLRAKFRALAKRNAYPETLAESMVTAEMTVYAVEMDGITHYMDSQAFEDLSQTEKERVSSKKTVVAKGELLTMNDTEAVELGFSRMSVDTIDEMLQQMEIKNYTRIRIEESWSETLVRFIGGIAPLLLMIGLAALYIEIKAPGFGLPGILGIICLFLVFINQYLVGLADYTELLLLVIGFILLGFELFVIPGFGVTGIAGLLFITAGAILALQDFVIPDPSFPWQAELLSKNILHVLGALFMAVILALFTLRYILPKLSAVVNGPYLETTLKDSHADSLEARGAKTGDIGVAVSLLRPSGKVRIQDDIFDVVTEGEFIEKGMAVIIKEIVGNRIIVARKPEDE
jgi:membrane-bound serine protease (ClpP class)